MLLAAAAANLLGLSDGVDGVVETSTWASLWVSNCSTVVTVTEVGCGPLLISYRQHLIAWRQCCSIKIRTRRRFSWEWLSIGALPQDSYCIYLAKTYCTVKYNFLSVKRTCNTENTLIVLLKGRQLDIIWPFTVLQHCYNDNSCCCMSSSLLTWTCQPQHHASQSAVTGMINVTM